MWSGLTGIAYGILRVLALLNPGRNTIVATDLSYGLNIDQIRPSIDLDFDDSRISATDLTAGASIDQLY
jgi:hypothetical protein